MRPRVFPAEDTASRRWRASRRSSFNEAAGIPRGRLSSSGMTARATSRSFNEAAGIPRGRRHPPRADCSRPTCFNEAAGIPRGRPAGLARGAEKVEASMRPRVFPAEDISRRAAVSAVSPLQ